MERGWQVDASAASVSRYGAAAPRASAIEQLPHEVLIDIFSYLDAAALAQVAATSSLIRQVALQDVLWKPFLSHAIDTLSPPVTGPAVHPLESALPLWHPDFGLQADVIHPPSWPTAPEFVQDSAKSPSASVHHTNGLAQADFSRFEDASSLYEVYVRFIRPVEPLLGWWASDVPFYGMVVRIVLDMHFTHDDDDEQAETQQHRSQADRASSQAGPSQRQSPSIVCQRVYPTNRLQGLDSDMARWSEVVGFPMPGGAAVIGQGTILRRSLTQIRTDLCEPGIRTENLWHFSWQDARRGHSPPSSIAPTTEATGRTNLKRPDAAALCDARAHISSQSWLRSLEPGGASRGTRRHRMDDDDDDDTDEDADEFLEDEAEEIDRILRRAAEAPAFFNFGFDLVEDDPANMNLRHLIVGPHRHTVGDLDHRIYPLSGAVSTRSADTADDGTVQVSVTSWNPYTDAEMRNAAFAQPPSVVMPLPPTIFPPPALLPAIRSVPWSRLDSVQIGMSGIWESMSAQRRWLIEGERLTIDSLIMTPPPPYRPWPIQAHALHTPPRFYPIRNPDRASAMTRPSVTQRMPSVEAAVPASLASFGADVTRPSTAPTSDAPVVYQHVRPPNHQDPAHVDFDWSLIEGLYSMTYGPHGMELLYIRARELSSLDFEPHEGLPAWPAEPLLSSDDMYEQTRISRRSAARVGARVLEAVKVLGDPNIPRGQVTWRAFIDDPGRSAVAWRPPPDGFRKHTPWPLRPSMATGSQEERSPGIVLPAHGRVAGEGFVGPGWATALACISSLDEIQIWWEPMYKVSVAKRLVGM